MREKRRKTNDARVWEIESEQEEHSLSLSQHSSPSQSDQEQNTVQKLSRSPNGSISASRQFIPLKLHHQKQLSNGIKSASRETLFLGTESPRVVKTEQLLRGVPQPRHEVQFLAAENKPNSLPATHLFVSHSQKSLDLELDCSCILYFSSSFMGFCMIGCTPYRWVLRFVELWMELSIPDTL